MLKVFLFKTEMSYLILETQTNCEAMAVRKIQLFPCNKFNQEIITVVTAESSVPFLHSFFLWKEIDVRDSSKG